MTKFILIRHGYSEFNHLKKFAGQLDVALTPLGVRQAQLSGEYILKNYQIDAVYASDLSRAVNTAKPVADALGLPVHTDKRLRELDVGVWTNMLFTQVREQYAVEYAEYRQGGRCLGGESMHELQTRAVQALRDIDKSHENQTVLIASHGGTIRAILRFVYGYSLEEANKLPIVANGAISEITLDNDIFEVVNFAYEDHLISLKTQQDKHLL